MKHEEGNTLYFNFTNPKIFYQNDYNELVIGNNTMNYISFLFQFCNLFR